MCEPGMSPAAEPREREYALDESDGLHAEIMRLVKSRLGDRTEEYAFPPPVFTDMCGEFVSLDLDAQSLVVRFPVYERYLNPYGSMQGGTLTAAVDNTIGPLSMLVAPPNVTRRLETIYSRPATPDMESIEVRARLAERKDRWLFFKADVCSREGVRIARASSTHFIVDGWDTGGEEDA